MNDMLTLIEEYVWKLQAEIACVQGKENLISDRDLELLTRCCQKVAIRCRDLWSAHKEVNCSPGVVAPTPGGAFAAD